jgi:hypothetical protein
MLLAEIFPPGSNPQVKTKICCKPQSLPNFSLGRSGLQTTTLGIPGTTMDVRQSMTKPNHTSAPVHLTQLVQRH